MSGSSGRCGSAARPGRVEHEHIHLRCQVHICCWLRCPVNTVCQVYMCCSPQCPVMPVCGRDQRTHLLPARCALLFIGASLCLIFCVWLWGTAAPKFKKHNPLTVMIWCIASGTQYKITYIQCTAAPKTKKTQSANRDDLVYWQMEGNLILLIFRARPGAQRPGLCEVIKCNSAPSASTFPLVARYLCVHD